MGLKEAIQSAWDRYQQGTDEQFSSEELSMGPWTSYSYVNDPRHLTFVLARYKFCAKMLEGKDHVVEIGCGDGIGVPIMSHAVKHLHCIDWDERNLDGCARRLKHLKNITYQRIDLNRETMKIQADAAYSIDVIEHIEPALEARFMENLCALLKPSSVLITGTPNITASPYASKRSEVQHINLKSQKTLRELTLKYFKHAFQFGMNDEVLHTGYHAMCHYIWSMGVEKIGK